MLLCHNLHSFFSVKIQRRCHSTGSEASSSVSRFTISARNFLSSLAIQIADCFCNITTSASHSSGVICDPYIQQRLIPAVPIFLLWLRSRDRDLIRQE